MSYGMGSTGAYGSSSNKKVGGYESFQMPNFTPEQMQLFKNSFANVGPNSFTGKLAGGDQETFNQLEAPAMKQFSGMQGNLASRFSGMGSTGARKSSGFQNTMNQASSDFGQQLQSNRMGLQQQAIKDLMGMSNQLLNQRPYENYLVEEEPSWWEKLLGGLAPAAGAGIGGAIGSVVPGIGTWAGAKMGGQAGSSFSQAFRR